MSNSDTPRFELIQCLARLQEIATPWQILWLNSGASPFQSHSWITEWTRHLPKNRTLHIGALWQNATDLLAIIPCAIYRRCGFRIMEWAAQDRSDLCDGLGDPISLKACWTALLKVRKYDIIWLRNFRPDAYMGGLLKGDRTQTCLLLRSVWPNGDAWMQAHYRKKRNIYSRGRRKLEEMGRVKVEFHTTTPPNGVVEQFRQLKQEWLTKRGLDVRTFRRWLYGETDSLPLFEKRGQLTGLVDALSAIECLLLVIITCNDEIVAGSINATHNRRLLSYFTVYNAKYERTSPGIILLTESVRWAFDHGFTELDHLRGEEAYKEPFSNATTGLHDYTAWGTIRGRIAMMSMRRLIRIVRGAIGRSPQPLTHRICRNTSPTVIDEE